MESLLTPMDEVEVEIVGPGSSAVISSKSLDLNREEQQPVIASEEDVHDDVVVTGGEAKGQGIVIDTTTHIPPPLPPRLNEPALGAVANSESGDTPVRPPSPPNPQLESTQLSPTSPPRPLLPPAIHRTKSDHHYRHKEHKFLNGIKKIGIKTHVIGAIDHLKSASHHHSNSSSSSLKTQPISESPHTSEATLPVASNPSSSAMAASSLDEVQFTAEGEAKRLTRPFLKIRIATFNMHDSLPTSDGDLSDFLGVDCSPSTSRARQGSASTSNHRSSNAGHGMEKRFSKSSKGGTSHHAPTSSASSTHDTSIIMNENLPMFDLKPEHPYHVIVVCGQECPTASGVMNGKVKKLDGKGWTSRLENWLCGGVEHDEEDGEEDEDQFVTISEPPNDLSTKSPTPILNRTNSLVPPSPLNPDDRSPSPALSERTIPFRSPNQSPKGPYILVEKERLMGIYCAVFVARSCDPLVGGTSTGRVTSGLIGGRVGNKGGVGISLLLGSSRILFISAHLAAHASGLALRKANAKKIFDELVIDDFKGKGPRAGDLMNRFDQVFFMGDLNFRLNVSRLHADWIVRTKDYVTALQFDQLRDVLAESDSVFKGFKEGEITFAPTYKYDVEKLRKKRSLRHPRSPKTPVRKPREWTSFEPADVELDEGSTSDPEVLQATRDAIDTTGSRDDTRSMLSSKGSIDSNLSEVDKTSEKNDLVSLGLPSPPSKGNETSMEAMRKAQVKFLTLVRSNSAANTIAQMAKTGSSNGVSASSNSTANESSASGSALAIPEIPPKMKRKLTIGSITGAPFLARPILRSSQSELTIPLARSNVLDGNETGDSSAPTSGDEDEDKGQGLKARVLASTEPVFDSSSKQRVQSYTDRILFHTSVVPDEPSSPGIHSRATTFVDSIKGLVHGHTRSPPTDHNRRGSGSHPNYFDLHAIQDPLEKIREWKVSAAKTWQENVAHKSNDDEDGQAPPFSKWFAGRNKSHGNGLTSQSQTSLSSPELEKGDGKRGLTRANSLGVVGRGAQRPSAPRRRSSLKRSYTSYSHHKAQRPGFWRRRSSGQLTITPPTEDKNQSPHDQSLQRPPLTSTAALDPDSSQLLHSSPAVTPTGPSFDIASFNPFRKRTGSPRSGTPRGSPEASRNNSSALVPTLTEPSLSATPTHIGGEPEASSSTSLGFGRNSNRSVSSPPGLNSNTMSSTGTSLNRFKSFFHLPSFLTSTNPAIMKPGHHEDGEGEPSPTIIYGPRKGEIQVIEYGAVTDMIKMGATSDHRPVYLVAAVGLGGEPVWV